MNAAYDCKALWLPCKSEDNGVAAANISEERSDAALLFGLMEPLFFRKQDMFVEGKILVTICLYKQ